jgi:hypothetical protein
MRKFMDWVLELRAKHPRALLMSFNILRFPSFQAIPVLPKEVRHEKADELEVWLDRNGSKLEEFEREGLKRTIAYAREVEEGHSFTSSLISRQRDFKSFFKQYDARRKKSFTETFPELAAWYDAIPDTIVIKPVTLVSGDSSTMTQQFQDELKKKAEEEGWVLNPQNANPGSQEFNEL